VKRRREPRVSWGENELQKGKGTEEKGNVDEDYLSPKKKKKNLEEEKQLRRGPKESHDIRGKGALEKICQLKKKSHPQGVKDRGRAGVNEGSKDNQEGRIWTQRAREAIAMKRKGPEKSKY